MDIIRKFYEPDLGIIMKIWQETNLEVHDFVDPAYWERNYSYVSRMIPKSEFYVYEIDGKVVGFIGLENDYIAGLFVHRDYRRMGIGTKLIRYVKEDHEFLQLHVFEKNEKAVQFYLKNKFRKRMMEVNEDLGEIEYNMYFIRPKEEWDE